MTVTMLSTDEARQRWPELVSLAVRAKAGWGYSKTFLERFQSFMAQEFDDLDHLGVFVSGEGVDVVGFACIDVTSDGGWLEDLWIEPSRQAMGYGRELLAACLNLASEVKCEFVRLESDPHAATFYEACGWYQIGVRLSTIDSGRLLPLFQIDLDVKDEVNVGWSKRGE